MRSSSGLLSIVLVYITLAVTLSLAEPIGLERKLPQKLIRERSNGERVGIAFGRPGDGYINQGRGNEFKVNGGAGASKKGDPALNEDGTSNYLVTLERTVSNTVKDKILDVLLRSGAVVKQTYDYRVFKGILFTIPSTSDKGLESWQQSLGKQEGVKYVEEDSIVKIQ